MAQYKEGVLTTKALDLIARAQAGEATINFTKVGIGSGTWSSGTSRETLMAYNALKNKRLEVNLSSKEYVNNQTVNLKATFTNSSVTTGFSVTEVGIWASDGSTEFLYAIYLADYDSAGKLLADWMPAYNSQTPSSIKYTFQITVANADEVTLTVDSEFAEHASYIIDDDNDVTYAYFIRIQGGKPCIVYEPVTVA